MPSCALPLCRCYILGRRSWFISCKKRGMMFFNCASQTRWGRISVVTDHICSWGRAVLVVFMIQHLAASDLSARSQSRPDERRFRSIYRIA